MSLNAKLGLRSHRLTAAFEELRFFFIESVCVCVCLRERERGSFSEREKMCESVCV